MTALISISIILALCLGAAIVIAMRRYYIADNLHRKSIALRDHYENDIEVLEKKLKVETELREMYAKEVLEYKLASLYAPEKVSYVVSKGTFCYSVIRVAMVDNKESITSIKQFRDEDMDFNRREAEELCEMLNS